MLSSRGLSFLVVLALVLLLPAHSTSSTILGVRLPGKVVEESSSRLALREAFLRVASLVKFPCDPLSVEVFHLEAGFSSVEQTSLEKDLRAAGWDFLMEGIGETKVWLLERSLFGRKARALLAVSRDGEKGFIGVCTPLF
jgi:hypothetical protein